MCGGGKRHKTRRRGSAPPAPAPPRGRLFTSDRHSRFSFDSETDLSYRQHTTSEESMFMAGMANAVSNVNVNEQAGATSTFHSSAVSGGGGLGIDLGFFSIGGSASGSSYDSKATRHFRRNPSQHTASSSWRMGGATRSATPPRARPGRPR